MFFKQLEAFQSWKPVTGTGVAHTPLMLISEQNAQTGDVSR